MFRPDTLLQIAIEAKAAAQTCSSADRTDHMMRASDAVACAQWMENKGFTGLESVGPFMSLKLKQHDLVTIRRGALIYSTHPKFPAGRGIASKRTQKVKVTHVYDGRIDYYCARKPEVVQATVHWAGAGGYWRWTDINNVVLVSSEGDPRTV